MSVLGALAFGLVGALVVALATRRRPEADAPWSAIVTLGTGAYRQQDVERATLAPARVRLAVVVAWIAIGITALRAAVLVLEILATERIAVAGYTDCAELPCTPMTPPSPSVDVTTLTTATFYLVALGALFGALGSWAMHARKNVLAARNPAPIAWCGLVVVLALLHLFANGEGHDRAWLAGITAVHVIVLVVSAACLADARRAAAPPASQP